MPVRYEIDAGRGLLLLFGSGVLRDPELERTSDEIHADPAAPNCMLEIHDWRGVTRNELSAQCLRRIADGWKKNDSTGGEMRLASVSPRDVEYGLMRMYQAFRGEKMPELRLFRDMAEAEAWLGLPRGHVDSRV